jgi:cobalt-zinc-cadmium efflux system membrane fusion protein
MGAMLATAALAAVTSCSRSPAGPTAAAPPPAPEVAAAAADAAAAGPGAESPPHVALPSTVRLSPEVLKAAGIETAPATLAALPTTVDLAGEVAADPDRSAQLAARVAARIVEVRRKEGDRIKAGEIMAVLTSPEVARARAQLASAAARAKASRLNARRLENLAAKALASGQEVASAQAEAAALEAEENAARQTLAAFGPAAAEAEGAGAKLTIRSPLAGFVLSRDAIPGQTVSPEHVIAVVGNLDRAYFLGRLFEKDLAHVQAGASAEVRLNAYPHEVFQGKVETIGRQVDRAARTVTARIVVDNHDDRLKVGLYGTARVVSGRDMTRPARLVVPLTAVTRVADRNVVFAQAPDGSFEMHPVTLGATAGGRAEVLSGLGEGERIVVRGVFTLKSAVLKGTFGEKE